MAGNLEMKKYEKNMSVFVYLNQLKWTVYTN